ncbi:MAG TPA: nicotinate-nucleotide adenylyltransferase [Pseudomonadales bacterium]
MICLFGGTFDPIHLGHLHAADVVCRALDLVEIRLVLSARPSHRMATGASLEHRWAMLQLACEDDARFVPDDREMRRDRPSYTVETLEAVRSEMPGARLCWVIGSDAYAMLPSWHRWQEVLKLANLVVLARPGPFPTLDERMQRLTEAHRVASLSGCRSGGVLLVDNAMKQIAAADIRAAIAEGRDVSDLLPLRVANYIRDHQLYGA